MKRKFKVGQKVRIIKRGPSFFHRGIIRKYDKETRQYQIQAGFAGTAFMRAVCLEDPQLSRCGEGLVAKLKKQSEIVQDFENLVFRNRKAEDMPKEAEDIERGHIRRLWQTIIRRKLQGKVRSEAKLLYEIFYRGKQ